MMDVDLMVPAAERIDLLSSVIGYTYIRNTHILKHNGSRLKYSGCIFVLGFYYQEVFTNFLDEKYDWMVNGGLLILENRYYYHLGRECRIRRLENPNIAKKGGGSYPRQDFFGGFVEVSQKPYSGITQPK